MAKTTPVRVRVVIDRKATKLLKESFHRKQQQSVDRVAAVLWNLLRDHVPFGKMEEIVRDLEKCPPPFKYAGETATVGNHLAENFARRILSAGDDPDEFDGVE